MFTVSIGVKDWGLTNDSKSWQKLGRHCYLGRHLQSPLELLLEAGTRTTLVGAQGILVTPHLYVG